jgi:DNA repair photolyase
VIPALNDDEMEAVLTAAADAGARAAGDVFHRLAREINDLFREWLVAHVPDRGKHVLSLMKSMRGGKDYDATWGKRMSGSGPYANMIAQRFQIATRRLGLNETRAPLDTSKFRPPAKAGDQLALAI